MSPKRMLLKLAAVALCLTAFGGSAAAQQGGCATGSCASNCSVGCQTHHCPPALHYCQEGAPCIKFHCGCPRPVCCPCDQPNWGYYQTCWRPWPNQPNWSHCTVPGPAAFIPPGPPEVQHSLPVVPPASTLPAPRKVDPAIP